MTWLVYFTPFYKYCIQIIFSSIRQDVVIILFLFSFFSLSLPFNAIRDGIQYLLSFVNWSNFAVSFLFFLSLILFDADDRSPFHFLHSKCATLSLCLDCGVCVCASFCGSSRMLLFVQSSVIVWNNVKETQAKDTSNAPETIQAFYSIFDSCFSF